MGNYIQVLYPCAAKSQEGVNFTLRNLMGVPVVCNAYCFICQIDLGFTLSVKLS